MSTAMGSRDAPDDSPLISMRNVSKRFGTRQVLDGLDLDVERGETLVIMGPSGTGKSVTLRHIVGLIQPDSGTVTVDGHDMVNIAPRDLAQLRRRMGYLFQEGALINWLSAGENVALPLRENSQLSETEIRSRVEQKLDLVHLPDTWETMPSDLSGGMKKRVGLARALITNPEIILYDEPNAGLDPEISMSINHLIRELANNLDVTSVVITHLVSCVRVVADRVVLLDGGRVVEEGTSQEFLASTNPRVVRFLGPDPD